MRIKYDFEDEYKDGDLGEFLNKNGEAYKKGKASPESTLDDDEASYDGEDL